MQMPAAAASPSGDGGGGSGCCAVTLLVYKGVGLVAWLGDARCVLARREKSKDDDTASIATAAPPTFKHAELNAFAVSKDHKAVILKEKQRIEKVRSQSCRMHRARGGCVRFLLGPPLTHVLLNVICMAAETTGAGGWLRQRWARVRHYGGVSLHWRRSAQVQGCQLTS
jgi:hypothetical protein